MKFLSLLLLALTLNLGLGTWNCSAQDKAPYKAVFQKQYKYDSVPNDPTRARIYTLGNGLKVYMSVYKDAPRIQTYIAVRAGSKNDPADATGMAHYLEHMLFKGTDTYGTLNFSKEEMELKKIDSLYDIYGKTKDPFQRKKIYHNIDSISGVSAKYSIANEYDKMMSNIGARGTNAYTWMEQTVYMNDIPTNQLYKWLTIESERFRKPVMRLFHTELEAVYEEKNTSLDNDYRKMDEALYAGLWQKHTYGTQTTIGTIDHLKNPSLKKIKEYESTYYVANNMALCIAGDFDPDSTIKWIDQTMGLLISKPVPGFNPPVENLIIAPIVKNVTGPFPETMSLGFRFSGIGTKDAELLELMSQILYNGKAGLIDLDLVQQQKALAVNCYPLILKDYSAHIFSADPKEGQKLEDLTTMLLAEIEKVKKGDFPDWLIPAIISNSKLQETKTYESNNGRASAFVQSFIDDLPWEYTVNEIDRLSKITKQDIIDFAKKNYGDNYVVVYKRTGTDSISKKVDKPEIHPVETNRNEQSSFLKNFINIPADEIEPKFVDYAKDIQQFSVKKNWSTSLTTGIPAFYNQNTESQTFSLYYLLNMGSNHNKKLPVAIEYLPFLGTSKYTPEQLQQEFYKLACDFGVFNSEDQVYVYLSGLTENSEKALTLFESLLGDAKPNPTALNNLVDDILKQRTDAKLDKKTILWSAMYNYAKYGSKSPFTNILSEKELKSLKPEELTAIIKSLTSYQHRILCYGSMPQNELQTLLNKYHKTPEQLKPLPVETKFEELPTVTNKVFAVNYDMTQAEILFVSKSEAYYKNITPPIKLFNEYFGSGMSSIVVQELRESQALAYSAVSNYTEANRLDKANYIISYIGTQADKLPEAMDGLLGLMTSMPESDISFNAAKKAVLENIRSTRITRTGILFNYEQAKRLGLDYDIRKDIYEKITDMKMADIKRFHSEHMSKKNYTILVLGNQKLIDQKVLQKYGTVRWLTLEEIFGY
ncbi:MAG: insulinase family protein [Bacteroidetes bacterium]|nr:insulinase family protein [Bacteroidota bacterium]